MVMMPLTDCPRHQNRRHHEGSASHHYCLLVLQIQDLSKGEIPVGTKDPIPELHYGKLNVQVAWHAIREAVIERDEEVCMMCGATPSYGDELEVHHIIPRAEGGSHHPLNLITLCKHCHHGRVHGGAQLLSALEGEQSNLEDYTPL